MPKGLETLGHFGNFVPAMERAGWNETKIRRVLGENWLNFLSKCGNEKKVMCFSYYEPCPTKTAEDLGRLYKQVG